MRRKWPILHHKVVKTGDGTKARGLSKNGGLRKPGAERESNGNFQAEIAQIIVGGVI